MTASLLRSSSHLLTLSTVLKFVGLIYATGGNPVCNNAELNCLITRGGDFSSDKQLRQVQLAAVEEHANKLLRSGTDRRTAAARAQVQDAIGIFRRVLDADPATDLVHW